MEYIPRHIEAFAAGTFQTFKCLLVTGARQTGKSTLLEHLFPNLNTITLDDEFIREQAQTPLPPLCR